MVLQPHPFFWLDMFDLWSDISSGFFRQHKQQKQKNRVQVLGDELSFSLPSDCNESVESDSFLRQQLEQQQVSLIRLQQGLQHLKQFMRLQQLGLPSSLSRNACFYVLTKERLRIN